MLIFDKKLLRIVKNRSILSSINSKYDKFLEEIAYDDLIERLNSMNKNFNNILELNYREEHLKNYFSKKYNNSNIVLSNYINNFPIGSSNNVICDNELICFNGEIFDLVVSVLDFHHINDLPGALIQIRNSLKNNGLFIASLFAEGTLYELKNSMLEAEIELNLPISPHIFPFAETKDLGSLLQRAKFKDIIIDNFSITASYDSVIELIHELRNTGESNIMIDRITKPLTKAQVHKINQIYKEKYSLDDGSIKASFNIATVTGIK